MLLVRPKDIRARRKNLAAKRVPYARYPLKNFRGTFLNSPGPLARHASLIPHSYHGPVEALDISKDWNPDGVVLYETESLVKFARVKP